MKKCLLISEDIEYHFMEFLNDLILDSEKREFYLYLINNPQFRKLFTYIEKMDSIILIQNFLDGRFGRNPTISEIISSQNQKSKDYKIIESLNLNPFFRKVQKKVRITFI